MIERFPIAPDTVTVAGYRRKATDPLWFGLDFTRAVLLTKANALVVMLGDEAPDDLHLSVPFCHPSAPAEAYEGVRHRVRPRMRAGRPWQGRVVKAVSIEPAPALTPPWEIVVEFRE